MKRIELANGIQASVLGFGCAPIMGAIGKEDALQAMAAATAQGVNYFDVAPSYGFGEAEAVLGEFLRGRRGDFVITTKFGIRANFAASLARPLKGIVRKLRAARGSGSAPSPAAPAAVPSAGPKAPLAVSGRFHSRVEITGAGLTQSVHRSLKNLQTDYLDGLLLHEPPEAVREIDRVVEAANALKQQGKLRSFGIAISADQLETHSAYISALDFVQLSVPESMARMNHIHDLRGDAPNVFFGAMRALPSIRSERPELTASEWLTELHTRFPRTVLLVSMFSPHHLEQNCALFK